MGGKYKCLNAVDSDPESPKLCERFNVWMVFLCERMNDWEKTEFDWVLNGFPFKSIKTTVQIQLNILNIFNDIWKVNVC